jgi:hypothetical protein
MSPLHIPFFFLTLPVSLFISLFLFFIPDTSSFRPSPCSYEYLHDASTIHLNNEAACKILHSLWREIISTHSMLLRIVYFRIYLYRRDTNSNSNVYIS